MASSNEEASSDAAPLSWMSQPTEPGAKPISVALVTNEAVCGIQLEKHKTDEPTA